MAIRYLPTELLKKIAPAKKIEKLVTNRLTLNKTVLSLFDDVDFLSKKTMERTALKAIKHYKERYKEEIADGLSAPEAKEETLNDKKLLVSRVQNEVISEVADEIKDQYRGEFYKWLPSDADTPDPLHQLNYGSKFQLGKGEMPGDRYGCRCGMLILVPEKRLSL